MKIEVLIILSAFCQNVMIMPKESPFYQEAQAAVREEMAKQRLAERHLEAVKMGARIEFRKALDIQSGLATPCSVPLLEQRFETLYKAPDLAKAIWLACNQQPGMLTRLRDPIEKNGALIEWKQSRTVEDANGTQQKSEFQKRYEDPNWIMAVASGKHPDIESPFHGRLVEAADCMCLLPGDAVKADRVVPLLDEEKNGDSIYEKELYKRIQEALPQSVGLIDQIAVDPPFAHLKLAAAARLEALMHIKGLPRQHPIQHMIGLAFCIQGVEVEGEAFDLDAHGLDSLSNLISLIVNGASKTCPAKTVGRQRNQKVPVSFEHESRTYNGNLLVDWYYLDHEMSRVQPLITNAAA